MPVSADDMKAGGAQMSQAIIEDYIENETFQKLGKKYLDELVGRDNEDGVKLQCGIDLAISKNVLAATVEVEPVTEVIASGKSPDAVTNEIIDKLGDAASRGCVLTLQGMSGTGKGTTVTNLVAKLPNAQAWSNGNIFRSLTLLATTYAEQNNCTLEQTLTPELLGQFLGMLSFDKYGDKFDTKIEGLGLKYFVSEVQNTVLKTISKFIPVVAEVTQGEVVLFIQDALAKMTAAGINVVLEGRTQTMNYIRTPYRFELILTDPTVVGMRQAALLIGSEARGRLQEGGDIAEALDAELAALAEKA